MKRNYQILIFVSIVFLSSLAAAQTASDSTALNKKIDSLFVIASSGELRYRDKVEPAIESIAEIGVPAVPHLIDKFTTHSARERLTIINILKKIGSPAVPELVLSLSRPEWLVVKRICWALGDIKDESAVQPLAQVANHSNWQVREYCIGALGKIGSENGLNTVLNAFKDSVGQVRKAAAYASGEIKNSGAIPALVNSLGDEFYGARFGAMEALLNLDTIEVISELSDSLETAVGIKANLICQTLGRIGNERAMTTLYKTFDNGTTENSIYAAITIANVDPDDLYGYRSEIKNKINDRLALIKIESAGKAAKNGKKASH